MIFNIIYTRPTSSVTVTRSMIVRTNDHCKDEPSRFMEFIDKIRQKLGRYVAFKIIQATENRIYLGDEEDLRPAIIQNEIEKPIHLYLGGVYYIYD